jgi:cellulose synthase/poly-beta-1,6-N-acetylglucosamine synthase-like glycosyltransferase
MYYFLELVFWSAVALVAYAYVVYPLLILRLLRAPMSNVAIGQTCSEADLPTVTVIVAAFNEEVHIAARIQNLLGQAYPSDKIRVLIGSDGSSDRTVEIARGFSDPRVTVLAFEANRGKASVLNDCAAQADSSVLVFTDANTVFKPDTIRELVAALDDDTAAACGELILQAPDRGHNVDHGYWSIERRLKAAESSIGGLIGANGGVYAIRRECYQPLRPDTIVDDFVIAMNIALAGKGLRYVPTAVAFEDTPGDVIDEYHRRVRIGIGIGNYQALFRHPQYLFDGPPALRFTYFSHKVLRWLTPHLLLVALICSLVLAFRSSFYGVIALLQIAGYVNALVVFTTRNRIPWPRLFISAMFFAVLNWAFLVGFKRYLSADYRGSWRRTERTTHSMAQDK